MAEHYASGSWRVKEGGEDEFVSRWQDWLGRSTADASGFGSAHLLRDADDPRHFLSFSDWEDEESRERWMQSAEFADGLARVRELCDDFVGTQYTQAARV